jgi:DNA-binding MarR family transcriptional regulator
MTRDRSAAPNSAHIEQLLTELPEHEQAPLWLGMTLTRLSRVNELLHDRAAAEFGLNGSEVTTLVALLASGPEHRMLPTEIRTRVAHTSAGVTGILRRLETKGLVSRAADPADGRRVHITLTAEGEQLVRAFLEQRATAFATLFGDQPPEELAATIATAGALVATLERAAGFSPAFRAPPRSR